MNGGALLPGINFANAIETRQLVRTFGDFTAVDRIDLTIETGSFFGFLGPNGAGKSTTIKMLTGLIRITSGSAFILGHDIEKNPVEVKKRIGVVPEEPAIFERLTGPEYLTFVARMYGLAKHLIGSKVDELLDIMDLNERNKLIIDYSHGMKKKLALSAALIHEPNLLFLDEPFEGIDAVAARTIKNILDQLLKRNTTIFLTSHILEIVEKLCNKIAIIDHGRLVAQGTMDELRKSAEGMGDKCPEDAVSLEELFLILVGDRESHKKSLSWLT